MKYKTTDQVRLRAFPGTDAPVIATMPPGTMVEGEELSWRSVITPDGKKGYCASNYLELVKNTKEQAKQGKWSPPIDVECFMVGQPFLNPDAETYPRCKHHPGVDYPLRGRTNVSLYFCADGEVIESGFHMQFGNYFFYYVPEADRTFVYFHLRDAAPAKGLYKSGEKAGFAGTTGKSTGPHLHLECMRGRKTSKERGQLYISKEALISAAEDADAFIRSRVDLR